MNKTRLIINPIAGTQGKESVEAIVCRQLEEKGWEVDVRTTRDASDAPRLAREAVEEGYYAVIAAGGDGTVNEIASQLCGTATNLGIIPCGSGNGLARHLSLPINVAKAAAIISDNHPLQIDYAEVNGLKFFCTCGLGFDAAVSELFAHKERRGLLSYLISVGETYTRYQPETYTLQIGGKTIEVTALLIAVCNASQYGNNVYISPHASIIDGLLDVTIIHPGNIMEIAHIGVDLLTKRVDKNLLIQTFRCDGLKIVRKEAGLMHIDGDPLTAPRELSFRCLKGGLSVFAQSPI